MKKMKNYSIPMKLIVVLCFFPQSINAHNYGAPFITVDKDGYTNVREKSDVNSKVVYQVRKYQVFFFYGKEDEECEASLATYANNSWLPIGGDRYHGYVYKKKILSVDSLPLMKRKRSENRIICYNDSINITIETQPFNKDNHPDILVIRGGGSDDMTILDMETEIKKVEIIYKNKQVLLPMDKVKNYCDPLAAWAYTGYDGEIYLCITGGGDAGQYVCWFSIVDGSILYVDEQDKCW
jgi:hypothetical protein